MSYELSFSESFFTGEEETQKTDTPTSILEAVENLSESERLDIGINVFGYSETTAKIWITTESFAYDVLERVRETDTCSNLDTPVRVWIDSEGHYTVDVY